MSEVHPALAPPPPRLEAPPSRGPSRDPSPDPSLPDPQRRRGQTPPGNPPLLLLEAGVPVGGRGGVPGGGAEGGPAQQEDPPRGGTQGGVAGEGEGRQPPDAAVSLKRN